MPADQVLVTVESASVRIIVTITVPNKDTGTSVASSLEAELASTTKASQFTGVPVETLPAVQALANGRPVVNNDDGDGVGAPLIGGIVGGVVVVILLTVFIIWCRRPKKQSTVLKVKMVPTENVTYGHDGQTATRGGGQGVMNHLAKSKPGTSASPTKRDMKLQGAPREIYAGAPAVNNFL